MLVKVLLPIRLQPKDRVDQLYEASRDVEMPDIPHPFKFKIRAGERMYGADTDRLVWQEGKGLSVQLDEIVVRLTFDGRPIDDDEYLFTIALGRDPEWTATQIPAAGTGSRA